MTEKRLSGTHSSLLSQPIDWVKVDSASTACMSLVISINYSYLIALRGIDYSVALNSKLADRENMNQIKRKTCTDLELFEVFNLHRFTNSRISTLAGKGLEYRLGSLRLHSSDEFLPA